MSKQYANQQIDELLERFMQGETSLAEEQLLADYFRSADNIPPQWEPYRTMFRYFDEGMPVESSQGIADSETPRTALEVPLNVPETPSNALEVPLTAPRLSLRSIWQSRWGRALMAAALVLLLGLVPLLHHQEKTSTQHVIAEHRQQPSAKPIVAQRQMPAEQPSSVQPKVVAVKKSGRKEGAGKRVGRAPANRTEKPVRAGDVAKTDADTYSEYVEEQARTIHNDVVEATYELLPVDKDLLHLATDENGLVKIVPTTAVHEL